VGVISAAPFISWSSSKYVFVLFNFKININLFKISINLPDRKFQENAFSGKSRFSMRVDGQIKTNGKLTVCLMFMIPCIVNVFF